VSFIEKIENYLNDKEPNLVVNVKINFIGFGRVDGMF
jgi:hypothetical protein